MDQSIDKFSTFEGQEEDLKYLQEHKNPMELSQKISEEIISYVNNIIKPYSLNDAGKCIYINLVNKYPIQQIIEGTDQAAKSYIKFEGEDAVSNDSVNTFLAKVTGLIACIGMPVVKQKSAYIKGIARNRFSYWNSQEGTIILEDYINTLRCYGFNENDIIQSLDTIIMPLTKRAMSWHHWKNSIEDATDFIKKKGNR